jgi:hypothetical protein
LPTVEVERLGDLLLLLLGTFTVAEGQRLTAEKQFVEPARFQRIAVLLSSILRFYKQRYSNSKLCTSRQSPAFTLRLRVPDDIWVGCQPRTAELLVVSSGRAHRFRGADMARSMGVNRLTSARAVNECFPITKEKDAVRAGQI